MIRSQNGTSRATSLETERKHCASETQKGEAVAARGTPGRQQSAPFTSVASGEATDKKFENTCRRRACRRLEREGQRRHVVNKWRCGKAGEDPTLANLSFLERVSVSHGTEAKYRTRVEQSSVLRTRITGARRGRRGRRGNRAAPEHEPQPRATCERWRGPAGGAPLLPTSVRKESWEDKLARSWRALKDWRKRAPTRSRRPLPRLIWSGVCSEMVREQETFDGHPRHHHQDTMRSVCRLHNSVASTKAPLQLLGSVQCATHSFGVNGPLLIGGSPSRHCFIAKPP